MKEKAYWVSEINQYIKHIFDSDFALGRIFVKGEVSNCKYHSSGHIYFTLKDGGGQISCIMFSAHGKGLDFRLKDGQSVVAQGNITVYEKDGKYQLYAKTIKLDGAGELYERFLRKKMELEDEGLFSSQYKQAIPKYAEKIGIVTAITGAAIHDIQNIARRRNPYVQLYLYPAKVQGEGAAETIVQGIQVLDRMGLDILIVGRGGGSIEDLWAFNEEVVARAIFECDTPVISAVGHETDVTIADFVADLRAPTPSAAAELAVCDIQGIFSQMEEYKHILLQNMERRLQLCKNRLENMKLRLEHENPMNQLQQKRHTLLLAEDKINGLMHHVIERKKYQLAVFAEKMNGLSPLRKLSQGYAFVVNESGKAVKKIEDVEVGEKIQVSVTNGSIEAVVESVEEQGRK